MIIDGVCGQLTGPRPVQNDAFRVHEHAVFVADGVGDSLDAHRVAELACARATALPVDERLLRAAVNLPREIASQAQRHGLVGASTLAGAVLDEAGLLWLLNIGDSRGYLIKVDDRVLTTMPHNQFFERMGLDPQDLGGARHVLTRSVGAKKAPPDLMPVPAAAGDVLVLATDGVEALVSPRELLGTVTSLLAQGASPKEVVTGTLERFDELGLLDNTTLGVFVIRERRPVVPGEEPPTAQSIA